MNTDEQIALDKYIAHLIWGLMLVPPKERSERSLMRIVSKIKQSILKAIMEKSLKTKEPHDNCSCNQCMYIRFRNRNLEEFESVIKEVLK